MSLINDALKRAQEAQTETPTPLPDLMARSLVVKVTRLVRF